MKAVVCSCAENIDDPAGFVIDAAQRQAIERLSDVGSVQMADGRNSQCDGDGGEALAVEAPCMSWLHDTT